jgi:hypothetical protein
VPRFQNSTILDKVKTLAEQTIENGWSRPVSSDPCKDKDTRYVHIREGDKLDEAQITTLVNRAAVLPGRIP